MKPLLIAYGFSVLVFFIIDFIWLSFIAKDFFQAQIGHLLKDPFNLPVAGVFYLAYVIGIVVFAVNPALEDGSWKTALVLGGLFGVMCYGAYDFTNWATLKGWGWKMVAVDVSWGGFLTGLSALAGYWGAKTFG